jgi:O-antigen ligase
LAFLSTNVFYSLFFAGEFISQILLVFVIVAGSKNQKSLIRRVLYCCVIVTVLSISFKFFRNGFGGELFAYKSNGGAACACIGAVFSFSILWSHSQGNRRLGYITFLICLLGIVLTTSAASIVSAFFGIALASLVLGKGRSLLLVFVLISAVFFAFNPDLAFATMFPGKDIEQVTSLHGRTNFWQSAYELFQVRPFFGYGYAMAAKIGHLSGTNLHNSIFSVLLGTGLVGVGIFIVGLIHVTNEAIRLIVIRFPVAGAAFAAFAAGLLNSNSISFFGEDWRGASFLFFMMWAIIGFLAIKSRELQLNRFKK